MHTELSDNPEYDAFVEKFKPKKTTDDCYTPDYIYQAVQQWVINEYQIEGRQIVRPFYPGGDFENFEYPDGCVVIDNPPFSILARIIDFYNGMKIDFFLFAPGLTALGTCANRCNIIITDSSIIYENGANVKTAFATNLGEYKIHVCPELYESINRAQNIAKLAQKVELPKYDYPNELLTAATVQKLAKYGQELKIRSSACTFVRTLDAQREARKSIFGGGMLLSSKAAAEKAAAEKAAARKWRLSDREIALIDELNLKE